MKLKDCVFKQWISWAEKIKEDLLEIVNNQQIFHGFSEIVQQNWDYIKENHGFLFCNFVRNCYAVQAAVGIRRHLKIDRDSVSLMKLMDQIKKCASQFTYEFYLSQYPIDESYVDWQEGTFSEFSHDGKVIAEDIIEEHMKTIYELGTQIETYVDRQLAHLDRRGWEGKLTFSDLKQIIDQFNKLACKYLSLINASGFLTLEPSIAVNWKYIFQVPLDIKNTKDLNE